MRQRTIKHSVRLSGIGLHTGEIIHVLLKPSKTLGISFNNIKVSPDTVFGTSLCTKIGQVRTIEHLMCALSILNITNLDIILDGDEIPILDGGASEFVNILKDNVLDLDGFIKDFFIPREGIEVIDENDPEKYIRAYPSGKLSISLKVDFNGLKQQFFIIKT
jgi:UDP-3-O-acyl-N-acetylglucosamine deacetylase